LSADPISAAFVEETWPSKFRTTFDALAPSLAVVLNAAGCREGWLQEELYRQLANQDPDFQVNTYELGPGKRADLHGIRPVPMIAELKVFGDRGFYNKNLDGRSNIDIYQTPMADARIDLTPEHLGRVHPSVDSLLRDYQRLREHPSKDIEKYLILVLHLSGKPDRFGQAVRAIRISNNELTFHYPNVLVRIWAV